MTHRFDQMIERVLAHEGGFTDDRRDPGNWTGGQVGSGQLKGTNFGIAANTYPTLDIRNLTREAAKAIYRRDFWDAVKGDSLPPAFAFQALDAAVNHGPGRARKWIQLAVGVTADGVIGPVTLAAIANKGASDLVLLFNAVRLQFYSDLPTWTTFGRGWARRVAENLRLAAEDN